MIPKNEAETVVVFAQACEAMGVEIVSLQGAFPDAIVRIKATGEEYRAEFEYQSSSFRTHRHDPRKCDLIICWQHDLQDCYLPVWELCDWKSADIVLAQDAAKEVMYWKMMYEMAASELCAYKKSFGRTSTDGGALVACGYGCGEMFKNQHSRSAHMRFCTKRNGHEPARVREVSA